MKILILGQGYVAHQFKDYYGDQAVISPHRVSDKVALRAHLEEEKPDVVINCIGKTGRPNVDWCEDHQEETHFANVDVPVMLAELCQELDLYLVHVGSGCIYTGDCEGEGFHESDPANFAGSYYSRTKVESEEALKAYPVLQLRLRMPLDGKPDARNFITKILKYEKVISVPNSISVMKDFLQAADALIRKRATGIYNMTNPGAITHEEILDLYKEVVDPSFEYQLFSLEELKKVTKAGRSNCVLSSDKLEAQGIHMRPIHEAVRDALEEYKTHVI